MKKYKMQPFPSLPISLHGSMWSVSVQCPGIFPGHCLSDIRMPRGCFATVGGVWADLEQIELTL